MRTTKRASRLLLLVVMMSLAACAGSGQVARPPASPVIPELPQRLLKKTDYAAQVRQALYEPSSVPSPSGTRSSTDTKPPASGSSE